MTDKELMQQAMKSTPHKQLIDELLDSRIAKTEREHAAAREIEKLRERLAQPDQEPEWYHGVDAHGCNRFYHKTEVRPSEFNTPLYTTPPQRKPLTDEEIGTVLGFGEYTTASTKATLLHMARALERAHGIVEKE